MESVWTDFEDERELESAIAQCLALIAIAEFSIIMAESRLSENRIVPLPIRLRPFPLTSNFFTPTFDPQAWVHVYATHFTPPILDDNKKLRRQLIEPLAGSLQPFLGDFILSGLNLFASKVYKEAKIVECEAKGTRYTLRIQYARPISMSDSQGRQETAMVLNVVYKKAMRALGLKQITRLPKYYDPQGIKNLPDLNLQIWRGYSAEINFFEGKPLLNIDFSSKIVHIPGFIESLRGLYRQGGDWKEKARSVFSGRIVMVKYGNNRCYRIDDIDFSQTPKSSFDQGGRAVTYIRYYKEHYNLNIQDTEQPLITTHIGKRGEERTIYLIPELVTLTGLDESQRANFNLMRELATYTALPPEKRMQTAQRLAHFLQTTPEAVAELAKITVTQPEQPIEVMAYSLAGESAIVGTNASLRIGDDGNFRLQNRILQGARLDRWVVLSVEQDRAVVREVVNALLGKFSRLGINPAEPTAVPLDRAKLKACLQKVKTTLDPQIVVIVLPRELKHLYQQIKLITSTDVVLLTQVVLSSMKPNRLQAICDKVAFQIQAKLGAELWKMQPSQVFGEGTMVIGMDVFHDTANKGKSVVGFCATINSRFSKYYSTSTMQNIGQEITPTIGKLFKEALDAYKTARDSYPHTIVFFRDGVGEHQVKSVQLTEVPGVLAIIAETHLTDPTFNPNLIFTVVVKRISAVFTVLGTPGNASNPPPGTLITSQVVPETGDFYLVSHYATQGTSIPTLYRTVYATNPASFPQEELARLAYKLSHMYYNWTGAIKVPAPCMIAHKIAFLIGKCVHTSVHVDLRHLGYYL